MNSQPLFQSRGWEFPGVLADEDSALPLLWLVVTAVARVQSPAQELLHATDSVKKKKSKQRARWAGPKTAQGQGRWALVVPDEGLQCPQLSC